MAETWRGVPRSELLERVQVALDGYHSEITAHEGAGASTARYIDDQLLPFLEAELERAEREEAAPAEWGLRGGRTLGAYSRERGG
jgi:hypothetical protein